MQVAIFEEFILDPQARMDCLKEVKILQNLEHPNIVKCYDSFIQVGCTVHINLGIAPPLAAHCTVHNPPLVICY